MLIGLERRDDNWSSVHINYFLSLGTWVVGISLAHMQLLGLINSASYLPWVLPELLSHLLSPILLAISNSRTIRISLIRVDSTRITCGLVHEPSELFIFTSGSQDCSDHFCRHSDTGLDIIALCLPGRCFLNLQAILGLPLDFLKT